MTWDSLVKYIDNEKRFSDIREKEDRINFDVDVFCNRYQRVFVSCDKNKRYIRISSPIGKLKAKHVDKVLLDLSNKFLVGGLNKIGDLYGCCTVAKLSSLTKTDLLEFISEIGIVTDMYEEEYLGVDNY